MTPPQNDSDFAITLAVQRHIFTPNFHRNMPQSAHSVTIDNWINHAKHYVCPPVGDALAPNRDLEYLLWQDKVECILSVNHKVRESSDLEFGD